MNTLMYVYGHLERIKKDFHLVSAKNRTSVSCLSLGYRSFDFCLPNEFFFLILERYQISHITVRQNVFRETEGQFFGSIKKKFSLSSTVLALSSGNWQVFVVFMHRTVTPVEPQVTWHRHEYISYMPHLTSPLQCTRVNHLSLVTVTG